jgi:succinate dehydrogenase / fumarate reductase cytochrome b subunit
MLPFVIFYIAAFVFLGFHLVHGFQSAFKTLGIDSSRWNPVIQLAALVYTVIIVGGFTIIPILVYFS